MNTVLVKAKWAHDHIDNLNMAVTKFFDSRPYVIDRKKDPKTLEHVYYYRGVANFPREITGHVGDTLYNLIEHLGSFGMAARNCQWKDS